MFLSLISEKSIIMKKFTALFCALIILFTCNSFTVAGAASYDDLFEAPKVPGLSCGAVAAIKLDNSQLLFGKNEDEKLYPAELTLIVTALVAFKNLNKDSNGVPYSNEIVKVGKEIRQVPAGLNVAGLDIGEEISVKDLFYALLIGNGSDAAMTLAVYIGRKELGGIADSKYSYDKEAIDFFVKMMNDEVRTYGTTGTNFSHPHSGYAQTHYITAYDYALICREYFAYSFLNKVSMIVAMEYPDWSSSKNGKTQYRDWVNTNGLVVENSSYYDADFAGIKYGYSKNAGECLASVVTRNGYSVIIVTLKSPKKNSSYNAIKNVAEYVYSLYVLYKPSFAGDIIAYKHVENPSDASMEYLPLMCVSTPRFFIKVTDIPRITTYVAIDPAFKRPTIDNVREDEEYYEAPILKGTRIGKIVYMLQNRVLGEVEIIAGKTVDKYEAVPDILVPKWYQTLNYAVVVLSAMCLILLGFIIALMFKLTSGVRNRRKIRKKYSDNRKFKSKKIKMSAYSRYKR